MMTHSIGWLACLTCICLTSDAAAAAAGGGGMSSTGTDWELGWQLREHARASFYHGLHGYIQYAWPHDELKPVTCQPRLGRSRGTLDDVLGNFSLTAVDSLPSLLIMGDFQGFRVLATAILHQVQWNSSAPVSTFETSIRILGALISSHAMLMVGDFGHAAWPDYSSQLLDAAVQVADRILPAFDSPTGLPFHRVSLAHGMTPELAKDDKSCTAAAGTFMLEFGALSDATGDAKYVRAAQRAVNSLWDRRLPHTALVSGTVRVSDGQWLQGHTGVAAGIDSYYEYLLKGYVLGGDRVLLKQWLASAHAVSTHVEHAGIPPSMAQVLQPGNASYAWAAGVITHGEVAAAQGRAIPHQAFISALQAFYPGLETMAGRVALARAQWRALVSIWHQHRALPELWDAAQAAPPGHAGRDSPLRPELLESTYWLYAATRSRAFLEFARQSWQALNSTARTRCGWASIADVATKRLDDRMDSFVLSETFQYQFLLGDAAVAGMDGYASVAASILSAVAGAAGWNTTALALGVGVLRWQGLASGSTVAQDQQLGVSAFLSEHALLQISAAPGVAAAHSVSMQAECGTHAASFLRHITQRGHRWLHPLLAASVCSVPAGASVTTAAAGVSACQLQHGLPRCVFRVLPRRVQAALSVTSPAHSLAEALRRRHGMANAQPAGPAYTVSQVPGWAHPAVKAVWTTEGHPIPVVAPEELRGAVLPSQTPAPSPPPPRAPSADVNDSSRQSLFARALSSLLESTGAAVATQLPHGSGAAALACSDAYDAAASVSRSLPASVQRGTAQTRALAVAASMCDVVSLSEPHPYPAAQASGGTWASNTSLRTAWEIAGDADMLAAQGLVPAHEVARVHMDSQVAGKGQAVPLPPYARTAAAFQLQDERSAPGTMSAAQESGAAEAAPIDTEHAVLEATWRCTGKRASSCAWAVTNYNSALGFSTRQLVDALHAVSGKQGVGGITWLSMSCVGPGPAAAVQAGGCHVRVHQGNLGALAVLMHNTSIPSLMYSLSVAEVTGAGLAASADFGPALSFGGVRHAALALASPLSACPSDDVSVRFVLPLAVTNTTRLEQVPMPSSTPPIVALAVRGSCSFVDKVAALQRLGASAVLVLDAPAGHSAAGPPIVRMSAVADLTAPRAHAHDPYLNTASVTPTTARIPSALLTPKGPGRGSLMRALWTPEPADSPGHVLWELWFDAPVVPDETGPPAARAVPLPWRHSIVRPVPARNRVRVLQARDLWLPSVDPTQHHNFTLWRWALPARPAVPAHAAPGPTHRLPWPEVSLASAPQRWVDQLGGPGMADTGSLSAPAGIVTPGSPGLAALLAALDELVHIPANASAAYSAGVARAAVFREPPSSVVAQVVGHLMKGGAEVVTGTLDLPPPPLHIE